MERPASARKRRLTPNQLLIGLFVLGAGLGVVGAVMEQATDDRWPVVEWLAIAILPLALWITLVWWRRLDEAAREAHKWAWYWGATVGMLLALPLLLLPDRLGAVNLARRLGYTEPFDLVSFGMIAVLVLQVAGYAVAWAAWWWRRR